ncbi:MAG: GNAT family N-acetyltransferase [Actinomycetota bacterium]|nr:GNAT family N-acetyltransferase [Actinomycetota bacterium]
MGETERLRIRAWREGEADRMFYIHRRPEVVRWFGTPEVMTDVAQARARIERYAAHEAPLGSWAIEELATGRVVGTALLIGVRDSDRLQVGWYLHPDSLGQGYATEAAREVLAHAAEAGYREVFAYTDVDNHPSHAVCRRLGMVEAGVEGGDTDRPSLVFVARS